VQLRPFCSHSDHSHLNPHLCTRHPTPPLQVIAALAILGRELGWATVPGLAVILLMLRLNKSIAAATFHVQQVRAGNTLPKQWCKAKNIRPSSAQEYYV
jgi:hypothetical protein